MSASDASARRQPPRFSVFAMHSANRTNAKRVSSPGIGHTGFINRKAPPAGAVTWMAPAPARAGT